MGSFMNVRFPELPHFPTIRHAGRIPERWVKSRLFEIYRLPHPRTFCWDSVDTFKKISPSPHKFPFVVKDNRSHEAEGVFMVSDSESLESALNFVALKESTENKGFITQQFIPSGGNVLRAVIMGNQILTYWKRPANPGQVITTISKGALIDHEWKPELQKKGKNQARVLAKRTGINLAAVDFIFALLKKDPEPLFLEINYYFGRRGLGGMDAYYRLLFRAIQDWLKEMGLNPEAIALV